MYKGITLGCRDGGGDGSEDDDDDDSDSDDDSDDDDDDIDDDNDDDDSGNSLGSVFQFLAADNLNAVYSHLVLTCGRSNKVESLRDWQFFVTILLRNLSAAWSS